MTENLLQKLEEKMMTLLSEVEELRLYVKKLTQEISQLKIEKQNSEQTRQHHERKLHDLISLLDAVNDVEKAMSNVNAQEVEMIAIHG